MFREMRRKKQEVSKDECVKILTEEKRGALAVSGDDGYPYAIPVNFYYDESENKIYFHCAREGHKLDAIGRNEKVCFTVWNKGFQKDGDWSYYVTSVVVFGKAAPAEGNIRLKKLKAFGMKYYPTEQEVDEEIEKAMSRVQFMEISIDHMTGKLVHER